MAGDMFTLKPLSPEGIEAALQKADRYRLLNEPRESESICRDVLDIDPDNQQALVVLILAMTDEFGMEAGAAPPEARELLHRLDSEYERIYYAGIIHERWAKYLLAHNRPGAGSMAYTALREAMACYEKAEQLRPPRNDDALLRWNACARIIMKDEHIRPRAQDEYQPDFE